MLIMLLLVIIQFSLCIIQLAFQSRGFSQNLLQGLCEMTVAKTNVGFYYCGILNLSLLEKMCTIFIQLLLDQPQRSLQPLRS